MRDLWDNLGTLVLAAAMLCIPLAILLSALGIQNPLTDIVAGLMGIDACTVGSQRPWLCGGP